MSKIGTEVKRLRAAASMTLEELADQTGFSVSYLSRVEGGSRNLSLTGVTKVAAALKVTESELLNKAADADIEYIRDRIRSAREREGMSVQDLASRLQTDVSVIEGLEAGTQRATPKQIIQLARFLRVDQHWLVAGGDEDDLDPFETMHKNWPRKRKMEVTPATDAPRLDRQSMPLDVPVRGTVYGAARGDFMFNGEDLDYVRRPPGLVGLRHIFALRVVTDSMKPKFVAGELIYVSASRQPAPDDYTVIEMHGQEGEAAGEGYVKQFVKRTPTKIIVRQFNPPEEIEFNHQEVKSLHRVFPTNELLGV